MSKSVLLGALESSCCYKSPRTPRLTTTVVYHPAVRDREPEMGVRGVTARDQHNCSPSGDCRGQAVSSAPPASTGGSRVLACGPILPTPVSLVKRPPPLSLVLLPPPYPSQDPSLHHICKNPHKTAYCQVLAMRTWTSLGWGRCLPIAVRLAVGQTSAGGLPELCHGSRIFPDHCEGP